MSFFDLSRFILIVPVSAFIIAVDCRTKRIPNWTCLFVFVSGLFLEFVFRGWTGLGAALIGGLLGFVAFLIPYLRGGMGGGDVKLMAAFGALLGGWKPTFIAILRASLEASLRAYIYYIRPRLDQNRRTVSPTALPFASVQLSP